MSGILHKVIAAVTGFIVGTIGALGYWGIVVLMGIESACIPLPSEIIMPCAGYLVNTGEFDLPGLGIHGELILAGLAGALGCLWGSLLAYWVGYVGGRPLVVKYGRYVLMTRHDLDLADRWFARYGDWAIFFSRLMPVVRTFISLPAGVARMRLWSFCVYTFVGSFPWCWGLAYLGYKLGEVWKNPAVKAWFHRMDAVIVVVFVLLAVWWVRGRIKGRMGATDAEEEPEAEDASEAEPPQTDTSDQEAD